MSIKNIRFTKGELRKQQEDLHRFSKYLPVIKIKKTMLQSSLKNFLVDQDKAKNELEFELNNMASYQDIFNTSLGEYILKFIRNPSYEISSENVAGVIIDIPINIYFAFPNICKYTAPHTLTVAYNTAVRFGKAAVLYNFLTISIKKIKNELKKVSIMSSFFENVLIPKINVNIKNISVFLEDQFLLSIGQSKAVKNKIMKLEEDF